MADSNKQKLNNLASRLRRQRAFAFLRQLKKKYPKAEVYLVGGAVRDALLGAKVIKDYDFVVRNVKAKDLQKFLARLGAVNLVGKSFGVLKFIPGPLSAEKLEPFDIALPRTERAIKKSGAHRDFKIYSSPNLAIEKDLQRRDFTINALALDLQKKELIDLFGGVQDLQKKIIRTVGEANKRFEEDLARVLRALRFACQLGFKIELKTWQSVKKLVKKLNAARQCGGQTEYVVPREVIAAEFLKAFYCDPLAALDLYDQSGAFKALMPELLDMKGIPQPKNWHSEGDVWTHTRLGLQNLGSPRFRRQFRHYQPTIDLIIAVLFHDLGKAYTLQTPEKHGVDRIRFNEHDEVGARKFVEIANRLKLCSPPGFGLDIDKIAWMITRHLLLINGKAEKMKQTTIEKYFFKDQERGHDFLALIYIDAISAIPETGRSDLSSFYILVERIKQIKKLRKGKRDLPKSLLDGDKIMELFNLKPGKRVGELKEALREAQLRGAVRDKREAVEFLREVA